MCSKFYISPLISLFLLIFIAQFSYSQIPLDGLVGYYMLDGNAADSSGMAHDGVIVDQVIPTENRFGEAGKASSFEGGYIDAGNQAAYQLTDAISIAVWINPSEIAQWAPIITKWSGEGGYYVGINPESLAVRWNITSPAPIEGNGVTIGEWVHIAATYDGDTVKLFENGIMVNSSPYSDPIINNSAHLHIGNQFNFPDVYPFRGVMDDALVYNRGLTNAEVEAIYGAQITATNNILTDRSVDIFPNPTNNAVRIQNNNKHHILSYSLYNSTGTQIRKATFQEELDISDEPSGIYYLLLNFEDFTTTKKIIKQ